MDTKTDKAEAGSAISLLTRWAEPVPEIGPAIYSLTHAPSEHKHAYHVYCPWSPDDRWICTDAAGPETTQAIFCDPRSGKTVAAMDCHECGGGYRGFAAVRNRPAGESVMATLERSASEGQTWQTQRHPAWSRDGSAVLVNADRGDGSQLYVIDVVETLRSGGMIDG